ncbi:hypothetical protein KA005_38490 [bacterium]|nr:hypothetical protein [bacterium]
MADNRKLYKDAVSTFGHAAQIDMMIKECARLTVEIQKFKLMRTSDVQRELADVEIMCAQMRLIFPGVAEVKKQRLARLQELIKARKEAIE